MLQPLASFNHPCAACIAHQSAVDTSDTSGAIPINQDAPNNDCTNCFEDNIFLKSDITVINLPLVSVVIKPERNTKLLKVVIPIFVPPQNLA
jgi:hypothetical protein